MANNLQRSTAVRNARLDAIETTIGTAAKVRVLTGTQPATCATAESGTLLVAYTLASDWASNASAGAKTLSGLPIGGTASGTGTAGYYRITDNAGTTCHEQGTVATATADMIIDNASIISGQTVNITAWTVTEPNA
jgi:hypothetical protein